MWPPKWKKRRHQSTVLTKLANLAVKAMGSVAEDRMWRGGRASWKWELPEDRPFVLLVPSMCVTHSNWEIMNYLLIKWIKGWEGQAGFSFLHFHWTIHKPSAVQEGHGMALTDGFHPDVQQLAEWLWPSHSVSLSPSVFTCKAYFAELWGLEIMYGPGTYLTFNKIAVSTVTVLSILPEKSARKKEQWAENQET